MKNTDKNQQNKLFKELQLFVTNIAKDLQLDCNLLLSVMKKFFQKKKRLAKILESTSVRFPSLFFVLKSILLPLANKYFTTSVRPLFELEMIPYF